MKLADAIARKQKSKLFVSLATKPGKTGETFYNALFRDYGLSAEYVACRCDDIQNDIKLIKEHCAGASITMPYKSMIADFIDHWHCDPGPVNTLKNLNNEIHAHNTDYTGMQDLISEHIANKNLAILGDGAMSLNIQKLATKLNAKFTVYSRRNKNWDKRHQACDVLINTTSLGMKSGECPVQHVAEPTLVIDCVIGKTDLITLAQDAKLQTIKGSEIYLSQFLHQFEIYTGIQPNIDLINHIARTVFND